MLVVVLVVGASVVVVLVVVLVVGASVVVVLVVDVSAGASLVVELDTTDVSSLPLHETIPNPASTPTSSRISAPMITSRFDMFDTSGR